MTVTPTAFGGTKLPLTNVDIRNARPKEKPYKLYDTGGLYLLIAPSGGMWWRLDYKIGTKRKTISLGVYPGVSLKDARQKRDDAKKLIKDGIDPSHEKKIKTATGKTVGELALGWFESKKNHWSPTHAESISQRIKNYIIPELGDTVISGITPHMAFNFLLQIEKSGKIETAHRVKHILGMIFRYGIAKGIVERNPVADLGKGMLTPSRHKHYPTIIEPAKVGELLRAIDGYDTLLIRYALLFHILTFVRPGELRHAEWSEIKRDDAVWEIPPEKMKKKRAHVVPLSRQALEIIDRLFTFTGRNRYLFPGWGTAKPISEVTMNAALRRLGYDTGKDITSHGVRAMARTLLHERLNFPPEVIEHQLAHAVPDTLGEAYNRTKFIEERKAMMQAWADYLDTLRALPTA